MDMRFPAFNSPSPSLVLLGWIFPRSSLSSGMYMLSFVSLRVDLGLLMKILRAQLLKNGDVLVPFF